jgi:hypothetical protein
MKKITFAGIISGALAALAIGLATPALADNGSGTVALPRGGPAAIYPQAQVIGGANPYTPFGSNPEVPFGVWTP